MKTQETTPVIEPAPPAAAPEFRILDWDLIDPSPTNPRKKFDPDLLNDLAASIRSKGIIQPLVVRPKLGGRFELVAGDRRWRAAKIAELVKVPAMVRELTNAEALEVQHIENLQREDLDPMEEAASYKALLDSGKYTHETLAEKLGKKRSHVFQVLRLTRLSKYIQELVAAGKLIPTIAAQLAARIPDPKQQKEFADKCMKGNWRGEPLSYREAENFLTEDYCRILKPDLWDMEGSQTDLASGSCARCPKRSGNMKEMFPDVASPNVCTDPKCFQQKMGRSIGERIGSARAKGFAVLNFVQWEKESGKYVRADSHCFDFGLGKTWKQIVGKEAKPTKVFLEDGEFFDAYPKSEASAAGKKNGFKSPREREASPADQKRRLARERSERIIKEVMPLLRGAFEKVAVPVEVWKMLAAETVEYSSLPGDRGVKDEAKFVAGLKSAGECQSVVIEGALCGNRIDYQTSGFTAEFQRLCEIYKVDLVAIGKNLDWAATAQAAAEKPAKKRGVK